MQSVYKKIIIYGLCFSLIMPLIVVKSFIFPFVFPKAIFFYTIIEILFAIYLFALYKYPKEFAPKKSYLLIAILIFLGISLIASIIGVNFTNSFFSTYERMDGVFNLFHFVLFFIMLNSVLDSKEEWIKLLRVSLFVSFIASSYVFGVYVLKLPFLPYGNSAGLLGNPLYLDAYLLPHIFLGVYLLYSRVKNTFTPHSVRGVKKYFYDFWLWFYFIITGFNIWALIFSAERGPQLGLYSGIIIAGIFYLIFSIKNKNISFKKIFLSYISIIAILFIIVFLSWNTAPIERLKTIGDFESASLKSRLITWDTAYRGIIDNPILGWGMGNFLIADYYNYNPERLSVVNLNFDKIHNKILEVGIDSGFLGIASYLLIFILALYTILKSKKIDNFKKSILIGLLIAYFIQNLTSFDSPATYLALFLSFAFIDFLAKENVEHYKIYLKSSVLFIFYFILFICFWQGVLQTWGANKSLSKAISLIAKDKTQISSIYNLYNESFNYSAMPYEARIRLAKFVVDNYNEFGYEKLFSIINLTEKELEKENKSHPNNVLVKRFLAKIYDIQTNKDKKYILKAENELKKAIEISHNNPMLYYSLGVNYYRQSKEKKAKEAFLKYLELHSNPPKSQIEFIEDILDN